MVRAINSFQMGGFGRSNVLIELLIKERQNVPKDWDFCCSDAHRCGHRVQSQQTAHGQYGDVRVGVDLTVLKPFFEDGQNPGTGMMGILAEDVPTGTENAVSGFNMKVAPRINGRFIGENGLGFKSSLWIDDHSGESLRTDFTTFGPNASVLVDTSMRFVSLDMEITQEITPGDWAITFGGGFCYAHAELNGTEETFINSYVTKTATIESQKQFDGFGPMLSVDALRPLAGSNLSLFARGKAAVVYGSNAVKVGFDFNVATVPVIQETITEEFDDFLPVFETQVGIAYQKSLGEIGTSPRPWPWDRNFGQVLVATKA